MQIMLSAPSGGIPVRDLLPDICKTTSGVFLECIYCFSPHLYILIYLSIYLLDSQFLNTEIFTFGPRSPEMLGLCLAPVNAHLVTIE